MARGATRDSLRRHNLSAVLQRVHRAGPQSRSALTQTTGLNRSTVGGLVAELEELGLVTEGAPLATGAAGRPSPVVRACTDHVVVAAVDIATKQLQLAVGGLGGTVLEVERTEVDNDERDYADVLADVCTGLDRLRAGLAPGQRLVGVGVAAPGVVRAQDGFLHVAPNLGWRDRPLGDHIAAHLGGGIPVRVANEAHLGARAEHLRGAGAGVDDLVYLSSEVGVGGGAVVGGHLHLGADGYSGEVGHLLVETGPGAARCRCGNTGCLESETGALALLRLSGREGLDPIPSTISAVVAAAAEGDQAARTALQLVGQRLGRGLGGLVNVLNPRRIVLGGWFAEAFDHLEPAVAEELARAALAPTQVGAQVVPAALRDRSALVGALEVVLEPLLADPLASPVRLPVGARA